MLYFSAVIITNYNIIFKPYLLTEPVVILNKLTTIHFVIPQLYNLEKNEIVIEKKKKKEHEF